MNSKSSNQIIKADRVFDAVCRRAAGRQRAIGVSLAQLGGEHAGRRQLCRAAADVFRSRHGAGRRAGHHPPRCAVAVRLLSMPVLCHFLLQ